MTRAEDAAKVGRSYDPVDWARDTAVDVVLGHWEAEATLVIREKLWRLIEEGWDIYNRGTNAVTGFEFCWCRANSSDPGYAPTLAAAVDAAWAAREAT